MRFAVACTLALLLAPPLVSSTEAEPRDAIAVSIFGIEQGAAVTWTPAPNAIGYAILRGPTLEDAVFVAHTIGTVWFDPAPLPGESWYTILSISPQGGSPIDPLSDFGGYRGSCIHQRGATGFTVTASHCIPSGPF